MDGDLPPKPMRIPFRKIRDHLAQIYKWQRRNRPIYGGLLEQRPNGFAVRRPEMSSGEVYTPPFSPVITANATSPTLGITKGHVFLPKTSGGSPKVEGPKYLLFPNMPQFQATALDATIAPTKTLGLNSTNYVYLEIALTQYAAYIGTDTDSGTTGADVIVEAWSGTGDADGHTHDAVSQHNNVLYEYTGGTLSFKVDEDPAPAEFPACTLTSIYIPWGIVVIDGDGNSTTDTVWYRTGDFDFFPNNYVQSSIDSSNPSPWTT